MSGFFTRPLFIFEMANNHMGDVDHGIKMIREFGTISKRFPFRFAFKFQLRTIPDFIHPDYRDRLDIKYVKRFTETALSKADFALLQQEVKNWGLLAICTPFDEQAVRDVDEMGFDVIKIASCSFTDWPLLEQISLTARPVIASTAGSVLSEIDNVVSFFAHRSRDLAVMHCVGEYPTRNDNLQLNQIDLLKARYLDTAVGFSTHEEPDNLQSIRLAVAKGAMVFEKHVAVVTPEYPRNAYSSTPEEIAGWLQAAEEAFEMCGVSGERHSFSEKEQADLRQFKRGAFLKNDIKKGESITSEDCYYAFPNQTGQLLANNMSKYILYNAAVDIEKDCPLLENEVTIENIREKILDIVMDVNHFVKAANLPVPGKAELEISHHYGLENFKEFGSTMITVINRDYCKKYIISLAGQKHPEQYHLIKEETFIILLGEYSVTLDGETAIYNPGDVITIKPGFRHAFETKTGGIMEEISTTHISDDSYYTDDSISKNKKRKTLLSYWLQ